MPSQEPWVFTIQGERETREITIYNLGDPREVYRAYTELMELRREGIINIPEHVAIIREINGLTGLSPKTAGDLAGKV